MKAAVVERYGPPEVVSVVDVPDPVAGRGQLLVRVHATTVNSGDARIRGCRFPRGFAVPGRLALGLRGPRRAVLGVAYSGVVEAVGAGVAGVAVGDEVCGMTGARMGAHAELAAVRADRHCAKPAAVGHEQAAAILFGGSTARHFLGDLVGPGKRVLVNGASGAVGSAAVQLARLAGAHVTGVCGDRNADLVRSLGADEVVDHARHRVAELTETYDVVLDTVGNLDRRSGRRLLATDGVLVLLVAGLAETRPRARQRPCGGVLGGPGELRLVARTDRGGRAEGGRRPHPAAQRDRRGPPHRRLGPQGRQPGRHALAAAGLPGVGNHRATTADCPSVQVELQTQ